MRFTENVQVGLITEWMPKISFARMGLILRDLWCSITGLSAGRTIMSRQKTVYLAYLESAHWKKLRLQTFERDGLKCCLCSSQKQLQGHHLRYRKDLKACTVDDIQTLCISCHKKEHRRLAQERKRNRKSKSNDPIVNLLLNYSATDSLPTYVRAN